MFEGFNLSVVDTGDAALRYGVKDRRCCFWRGTSRSSLQTCAAMDRAANLRPRPIICRTRNQTYGVCRELEKWYDVLEIWGIWTENAHRQGIDCGHYLAEGAPEETYAVLRDFLT